MQATIPKKRRKKRGKLYFSSNKALKTSRMGRKKVAPEKYETKGITKVLDFENIGENATLSTVDESEGPSSAMRRASQSQGASKEVGMESNPASNPASQERSGEEEVEETSLLEPEGGLLNPKLECCFRLKRFVRMLVEVARRDLWIVKEKVPATDLKTWDF